MTLPYTEGYKAREIGSREVMDRITAFQTKAKMDDKELADLADITVVHLLDIFQHPEAMTVGVGMSLAHALGCPLTTFITGVKYEVKG